MISDRDARRPIAYLVDLPTTPKGVLPLTLPTVAAAIAHSCRAEILDLNFETLESALQRWRHSGPICFVGLRVTAQSFELAIAATSKVRAALPAVPVIWAGETPTTLPDRCLEHADAVVRGAFEPVAQQLLTDCAGDSLRPVYDGTQLTRSFVLPAFEALPKRRRYDQVFGTPMETSTGCNAACTFCLVHAMQPTAAFKPEEMMRQELAQHAGLLVSVVDYNLGVDRDHLLRFAAAASESDISGWMCEMPVEVLDDDALLAALERSRCRVIYCGLESFDEGSVRSVGKRWSGFERQREIVRRAQAHGIQIAAGFILGLPGTTAESFDNACDRFEELGVIYVKLTFLTFSPGTRAHAAMGSRGLFVSDRLTDFDGEHLTFLPNAVDPDVVYSGTRRMIGRLTSWRSAWRRSRHLSGQRVARTEFLAVSHAYGRVYREWLRHDLLQPGSGQLAGILHRSSHRDWRSALNGRIVHWTRARRHRNTMGLHEPGGQLSS